MQNTKFTPGPWHIRTIDGSQWSIDDERHNTVAQAQQVHPTLKDPKQQERTANTQLIAAAPDLLEALQATLSQCIAWQGEPNQYSCGIHAGIVKQARAAIAKATGNKA